MTATATNDLLISEANHILNGRVRGRAAKLARLQAAGVPTDRQALQEWLEAALDSQHEAAGGLYHACTVNIRSGTDPNLPTAGRIGCRVTRVPIHATLVTERSDDDADGFTPYWSVYYGGVGIGWLVPVQIYDGTKTKEEVEVLVRERLLAKGECYRTRQEASEAAIKMLRDRVAKVIL